MVISRVRFYSPLSVNIFAIKDKYDSFNQLIVANPNDYFISRPYSEHAVSCYVSFEIKLNDPNAYLFLLI